MAHEIRTYVVRILEYQHPGEDFRRQAVLPGAGSPTPDVCTVSINHSLAGGEGRDAYVRAEQAAHKAAQYWFPTILPESATFSVEEDGQVLEVDLEMVPQYRARKPA